MLKGEKEIDINQINRERSMATVDEEEHAVLDRLTFDYHQKLQGKPQSHEMVRTRLMFRKMHFKVQFARYGQNSSLKYRKRDLTMSTECEEMRRLAECKE